MSKFKLLICLLVAATSCSPVQKTLTEYVNPFLGTATLWDSVDLGFTPTRRTWGAETFPGSSLPNAMVQVTPVTQFHSGSGYQYEDTVIYAIAHTSKGHWNLCHIPILPVTGEVTPDNYRSGYSHANESAAVGYYQVFLERYGINAEVTSTLRCAYHKYTYAAGAERKVLADLTSSNEGVRDWSIAQEGDHVFEGFQQTGEKMYFYAVANAPIEGIDSLRQDKKVISIVRFAAGEQPLELQIGFSFVSIANAKENLEHEMLGKDFAQVRKEATNTWETLLSKIEVTGGTERQRGLFYSSLYHAFLWPALRSDYNGDFTDDLGKVVNKGFRYYTDPSFWDDYRNKLVLLGMLSPTVAADVISSITDRGEIRGFMPTFFHGDHASAFVSGSYLRGLRGFDIHRAYNLILRNATVEGPCRPYLNEYMAKGYIAEKDLKNPETWTLAKASVTKTLEYAYDDYAVALVAKELGDTASYAMLMKRTGNYKNLFDPSTGLMRGRLDNGEWVTPFDTQYPYYEYMYREANAWQSAFFAPHDTEGLIGLYGSKEAFEIKVDSLFTIPWKGYEAHNLSGFIGQYCHGNQPDHSFPYLYYFVDKQEKSQHILNTCMERFYGIGKEGLSLAGMDDAGEMSSWYVFNAMGLYPYSPAEANYIVSVPLFDKVTVSLDKDTQWNIRKQNTGLKITGITVDKQPLDGFFVAHDALKQGELLITTQAE
ncbi:MAG: GH92 family glycosyl hydrolase [Alistipes sp.]